MLSRHRVFSKKIREIITIHGVNLRPPLALLLFLLSFFDMGHQPLASLHLPLGQFIAFSGIGVVAGSQLNTYGRPVQFQHAPKCLLQIAAVARG